MREDLDAGSASDFHFVPILIFQKVAGNANEQTINQQIASFLDNDVENPMLNDLLQSPFKKILYNVKTVGCFQAGNTFGGSPNSGSTASPIMYENYACSPTGKRKC